MNVLSWQQEGMETWLQRVCHAEATDVHSTVHSTLRQRSVQRVCHQRFVAKISTGIYKFILKSLILSFVASEICFLLVFINTESTHYLFEVFLLSLDGIGFASALTRFLIMFMY